MGRTEEFDQGGTDVRYSYDEQDGHTYTASKGGQDVGWLNLGASGQIADISVHHEHRRQGIATALWNHAVHHANSTGGDVPWPEHSMNRTDAGDAWAHSLGEDLPPRRKMAG